MLNQLKKFREEHERGFTLIELLVVILIIGILSAIAIPAFMKQREFAADSALQADLANSAKQIENWGVKQGAAAVPLPGVLTASVIDKNTPLPSGDTITVSDGTQLAFAGGNTRYCIQGFNSGGSSGNGGEFLAYDSGAGGMLENASSAVDCPATVLTQGLIPGMGESSGGSGESADITPDFSGRSFEAKGIEFNQITDRHPELSFDTTVPTIPNIQIRVDDKGRYELAQSNDGVWQHADLMLPPWEREIVKSNGTVTFTWTRENFEGNASEFTSYGTTTFEIKDGKVVTKTGIAPQAWVDAWLKAPGATPEAFNGKVYLPGQSQLVTYANKN